MSVETPTTSDLLAVVAAFLSDEVAPDVRDPRLRFRLLIAANILRIAVRDRAQGHALLQTEIEELSAILRAVSAFDGRGDTGSGDGDAVRWSSLNLRLVEAIDDGLFDDDVRLQHLLAYLQERLRRKLAVANPRFLESYA